ncbi:MAG: TetR/AcrR family transcriptional regulator [Microthrixaceae bacterium]
MSGVKQYERSELLDLAMDLFHRRSFTATSTADLVQELGINRKSMYAEFGSKLGLFEAALDHYNATSLSSVLGGIEDPDAGPDAIRSTFTGFAAASENWAQGRGCLLCNTAVERSVLDPACGEHVDSYFERLTNAFGHAVRNGQDTGHISETADNSELAAFFTMSLVGIATMAKGRAQPDQIHAATRVVLDTLKRHECS